MNKVSFFNAFSAMCDAVRGKMRASSRDVARRVSAMATKKFAALCVAAMCFSGTVWANTAAEIAAIINGKASPNITASVTGNTVRIIDGLPGGLTAVPVQNENFLSFSINAGVTVRWEATLAGQPSNEFALIYISGGTGTFSMQSGSIRNTGSGRVILNNSSGTINISGGTVETGSGTAIVNVSSGNINISGNAALNTTGGTAIYNFSSGTIQVSGGTVNALISHFNTNAIRNESTGTIRVSGGTVSMTAGTSYVQNALHTINNNSSGVVEVTGGEVSVIEGSAIYNNSSGRINISGGTIRTITNTRQNTAIYNANNSGTISISGNAIITSANNHPTILMDRGTIDINGGTVENTGDGQAIRIRDFWTWGANFSITVNIRNGSVRATNGNAIVDASESRDIVTINIMGGAISAGGNAIQSGKNLNISGGTVSVSGEYAAVYVSDGAVKITGGTISGVSYAVYNESPVMLDFGGNPTINGRIYTSSQRFRVLRDGADRFNPGTKVFTLDFPATQYATSTLAVMNGGLVNGTDFLNNFRLFNTDYILTMQGANLGMRETDPVVTVGAQNNALAAGTQGTVTFPITTVKIANGTYTATVANLPSGVSVQGQVTINNNVGTLTLSGNASTIANVYNTLRLTINGVQSNPFTLTIISANVGAQSNPISAGLFGNATFPVTTSYIANGQRGTVQWFSNAAGTAPSSAPTGVSASVSNVSNNSSTVSISTQMTATAGVYYFRFSYEGAQSNVATLTIKSVTIGAQNGTICGGTDGSAMFSVTTAQIATGQSGTVQWTSNTPTGVTATVTNVAGNGSATVTMNTTAEAIAGTYNFRVIIDGVQSVGTSFTVSAKSVTVGAQNGAINAGIASSATYTITTACISNNATGSISWFSNAAGTTPASAPTGITSSISNVSNNSSNLTLDAATTAVAGTYWFRVTIDDVQSNVGTYTVKRVSVAEQNGIIYAGTAGSATFAVTTGNITNLWQQPVTVQWFSNAEGTTSVSAPSGISHTVTYVLNNSATVTMTATTATANWQQSQRIRYFRVTIDGVQSAVATLTISAPKTVSVARQEGIVYEGTVGSATYAITTTSIANGRAGSVRWFSNPAGTTATTPPTGISASISSVSNNAATVTINATTTAAQGTRWFKVTIDGVESAVATLIVSPFVAVTNITALPTAATVGIPLTLTGSVVPSNATNKNIVWSVQSAGTTGATIVNGNILNTTATGTVNVRATISNGVREGVNYTQYFIIVVNSGSGSGSGNNLTTATPELNTSTPLRAWTHDGFLHVSGLEVGEVWSVYTVSGALIYRETASNNEAKIAIVAQGVYIIQSGERTVRVVVSC